MAPHRATTTNSKKTAARSVRHGITSSNHYYADIKSLHAFNTLRTKRIDDDIIKISRHSYLISDKKEKAQ